MHVKSMDPNHPVTVGLEGFFGPSTPDLTAKCNPYNQVGSRWAGPGAHSSRRGGGAGVAGGPMRGPGQGGACALAATLIHSARRAAWQTHGLDWSANSASPYLDFVSIHLYAEQVRTGPYRMR
jgi:hypothetical protein